MAVNANTPGAFLSYARDASVPPCLPHVLHRSSAFLLLQGGLQWMNPTCSACPSPGITRCC